MALPNARNQYLKTQIETASKEQLVVMLFDGIIRFTEQARKAIADGGIEDCHNALMRAQAIIMELICTVDKEKGGEVANNLMSLHAYAFNCLIVCNMKKDPSKIDEVQKIYRELREAWVGAMDSLGLASQGKPTPPSGGAKPEAKPQTVSGPTSAQTKPASPTGGVLASIKAGLPSAAAPATTIVAGSTQIPVPPAAEPAPIPKATPYGIGRSAVLGAINAHAKPQPLSAMPHAMPAPTPAKPTTPATGDIAPKVATTPSSAKHNALLNAYGASKRSIA